MEDSRSNGLAGQPITRRVLIKASGAIALTALVPLAACDRSEPASRITPRSRFLTDHELETLRAFVDRLIPEDQDPGAVSGCCAEAIDHLLAAFHTNPPFIYAGAPFSDRGGHPVNGFFEFVRLDAYEELAWRIAIEGSQGRPEREFNGPVKGMQTIYREGLARLDERAAGFGQADFASSPAPVRDAIIGDSGDAIVQELVDVGFPDTIDAMYGPPEYGGNCDFVGWGFTGFDGDVHPRGYTDEQVVNADNPGALDFLLPPSYHEAGATPSAAVTPVGAALAATVAPTATDGVPTTFAASPEFMIAAVHASDGRLSRLRAALKPLAQARRVTRA